MDHKSKQPATFAQHPSVVWVALDIGPETNNLPEVFAAKRDAVAFALRAMRWQADLAGKGATVSRSTTNGVAEFVLLWEGEQVEDAPHFQVRRCAVG